MKKYSKFIVVVAVAISIFLLYTFVLFDHQPFDDLKAGEIEKVFLFTDGKAEHHEMFDYSAFTERADQLELIKRTASRHEEHQGRVSVTIYYRDGSEQRFSVSPDYIHTDNGTFIGDREDSVEFLKYAFGQTLFGQDIMPHADKSRVDELIQLAIDGNSREEIRDWAKAALIADGMSDDMIKSFANQGYSPIYIYVLSDKNRNQLINQTMELKCDTQNMLLVERMWNQYKNSTSGYPGKLPPDDFIYGDAPDWGSIELGHNEHYTYATIPSADNKYNMLIYFDAAEFTLALNEVDYKQPKFRFVSFEYSSGAGIPADYPPVNVIKSGNALATADILTEKLTVCLKSSPETPSFTKVMFICMLSYIEDKNFCYYNIFPLMPGRNNYQFKTTNMEKIIRQVLGDYQWDAEKDFGQPPNGGFSKERQSFEFSTDFGWGLNYYSAKNITSSFSPDGKQVYSQCEIKYHDEGSDHGDERLGKYRAVYDIVTEDGDTFLRFNKYEKI